VPLGGGRWRSAWRRVLMIVLRPQSLLLNCRLLACVLLVFHLVFGRLAVCRAVGERVSVED